VSEAENFVLEALRQLPPKPLDSATNTEKKRYSELLSKFMAQAFGDELRRRGLKGARPVLAGDEAGPSGAERRMAGGIGAKKVDVTWATEESGLLLAISIKSINFMDKKSRNFQKNLTNRRGDMLFETVTLHRRFPYAVIAGFFFLDQGAAEDGSATRRSTFLNAHHRFQLFTGRSDPAGRDEQLERLYIVLVEALPFSPKVGLYLAGQPNEPFTFTQAFDDLIGLVAQRNSDFYEAVHGKLLKISETARSESVSKRNRQDHVEDIESEEF
jgi:hypothetical protein